MTASTRGRRNRQRGQEGEREAVAFLREHGVGCEDRLLGQERDGGYDLDTEAGPCDVKRRKKLPAYMIPREGVAFVMARQDYKRWYVVLDAEAWCRLWLRDAERTAYHGRSCPLCAQREAPAQCWLCAAASRIAAGEAEAEVMADYGYGKN